MAGGTVTNPASLSSVMTVFSGPGNLAAMYKGGSYVPSNTSGSISTTASGLALSQFNGVSYPSAALTASVSPSFLSGQTTSNIGQTHTVTTNSAASVTASGGTGSYTYSWQFVSGSSKITPTNFTSATTYFAATLVWSENESAIYNCKVTSGASTVTTGNVSIQLGYGPLQ